MSVMPSSSRSSSERPDRKRLRLEPDDDEIKVLEKHPTLYFDDGNIILSCGSTLFCVHRTLLAKHSPVFREMFVPKDDVKLDVIRGCKLFPMDDSREEMEALLDVMYNGLRIDNAPLTAENFPLLSSLLIICTKYEIERPRSDIIARIQANWPHDLASHDAVVDAKIRRYIKAHAHEQPNAMPVYEVHEDNDVHPAAVIALLRQCGYHAPELLAPIFYALSRWSKRLGGAAAGFNIAPLSHADIERLIVGIDRLRAENSKMLTALPLGQPGHAVLCGRAFIPYYTTRMNAGVIAGQHSPIEVWKVVAEAVQQAPQDAAGAPCPACCGMAAITMKTSREAMWEHVAEYFELK